jgi:hypothetical protein
MNQRSLIAPPPLSRTLDQWSVIMLVGTRIWKDGRGRRGIINTDLGTICRYMYPGMVSMGAFMRVARSWDDWGRKTYADQGSC